MDDRSTPLERYVRILEALAASGGGATAGDLVAILGLPRPSIHRLLKSMLDAQLIDKLPGNRYVVGDRMQRISLLAAEDRWFEPVLRPIVVEIADAFQMTTYVGKYTGKSVVSIMVESPEEPWRGYVLPGRDFAPHAAAGAKAILAFHPEPSVSGILVNSGLPQFTSKTLTNLAEVLAEYAETRRKGYGSCIGEIDEGLNALAVPIKAHGEVNMSIGITAPVATLPSGQMQAFADRLQRYSERIARLVDIRRS